MTNTVFNLTLPLSRNLLVAGSAFAIVQGPATLKIPQPAMTFRTFSIAGFLIGAGVLVLLELTRMLLVQKHPAD